MKVTREPVNVVRVSADEARKAFGSFWVVDRSSTPYPSIKEQLGTPREHQARELVTDIDAAAQSIIDREKAALIKLLDEGYRRLRHWRNRIHVWRLNTSFWPIRDPETRKAIQGYLDQLKDLEKKLRLIGASDIAIEPLPEEIVLRPYLTSGNEVYVVRTPQVAQTVRPYFEVEPYRIEQVLIYDHRGVIRSSAKNEYLDFLIHYIAEPVTTGSQTLQLDLDACTEMKPEEIPVRVLGTRCFRSREAAERYAKRRLLEMIERAQASLQML